MFLLVVLQLKKGLIKIALIFVDYWLIVKLFCNWKLNLEMIFVDKWGWAKFFWAKRTLESVTSPGWDPLCADPFLGKCARCSNTKEAQQKYNGNTIEIQTGCRIYCELLSIAFELAFVSWSAFGFSFSLFQFKLKDQYKSKHICTIGENMIKRDIKHKTNASDIM